MSKPKTYTIGAVVGTGATMADARKAAEEQAGAAIRHLSQELVFGKIGNCSRRRKGGGFGFRPAPDPIGLVGHGSIIVDAGVGA